MSRGLPWLLAANLVVLAGLAYASLTQSARIEELETEVAKLHDLSRLPSQRSSETSSDLERRIARLESGTTSASPGASPSAPSAAPNLTQRLEALAKEEDQGGPTEDQVLELLESQDPQVRSRIAAVVEQEIEGIRTQRHEQRMERWKESLVQRAQTFAQQTGLSADQQSSVVGALSSEMDQLGAIFRDARRDFSFGQVREKARAVREETDKTVQGLLSDEQYKKYEEFRQQERDRRGFGGRRGGRPGGPGGPPPP